MDIHTDIHMGIYISLQKNKIVTWKVGALFECNITRLGQDYAYNFPQKNKIVIRKVVALLLYNKTRLGQDYA